MRTVDEHLAGILAGLGPQRSRPPERVPLAEALGRVVADDVLARVDLPGFDNSSMDGYAVLAASLEGADPSRPVHLRIVGESAAGRPAPATVHRDEAVRIMTGAPLPPGADAVVPVEDTDGAASGVVTVRASTTPGAYVRVAGEDVVAGTVVVPEGTRVGPRTIALLAASGHGEVGVRPRPRVVVLSTGSELVPPGGPLGPGQIHDSNASMLAACVATAGGVPVIRTAVVDDEEALLAALAAILPEADLVVTSGGVSMGAYDVVKAALRERGASFVQVAMQPGKPQGFGLLDDGAGRGVPLVALPGNPVSAYVSFEVFVRPVLRRLLGLTPGSRPPHRGRLRTGLSSPAGRRQYARAVASPQHGSYAVEPVRGQGSHFVADLARANALVVVPEGTTRLEAGDEVDILLLDPED